MQHGMYQFNLKPKQYTKTKYITMQYHRAQYTKRAKILRPNTIQTNPIIDNTKEIIESSGIQYNIT